MSSAKNFMVVEWCRLSVISLMKELKRSGPRTLPCGTPLVTRQEFESVEFILTDWMRPDRNDAIQRSRLPFMP